MGGSENGYEEGFNKIQSDIHGMRDDLSRAIIELTNAVNRLGDRFDTFLNIAQNSIPIKAVMWMFFVLVIGLVGVEGCKFIFDIYLPKIVGTK